MRTTLLMLSAAPLALPLVCDRVLVLRDGALREEFRSPNIDQDTLMAACISGH